MSQCHESVEPDDEAYVLGSVDFAEDAHDAPDTAQDSLRSRVAARISSVAARNAGAARVK